MQDAWHSAVICIATTSLCFIATRQALLKHCRNCKKYQNGPNLTPKQSKDNKQASEGHFEDRDELLDIQAKWKQSHYMALTSYQGLIEKGMAKEQARCILPLTLYTEVYWTASFQAVMNFIELRNEKTAQIEIQEYAKVLLKFMNQTFPKTTKIWSKAHGWV